MSVQAVIIGNVLNESKVKYCAGWHFIIILFTQCIAFSQFTISCNFIRTFFSYVICTTSDTIVLARKMLE